MKIRNVFIISLVISFLLVLVPVSSELNCTVSNTQSLGTLVYKMSGLFNAHAELYTGSNYLYNVSCEDVTVTGVPTGINLNNNCDDIHILNLSSATNAHVEKSDQGNYLEGVCLSSDDATIIYSYETIQNCSDSGYQACLGTFSSDTNAHIADCVTAPYSNYICANLTYDFTCTNGVSSDDGACSVACGADMECGGQVPGYNSNSCTVGETYFIDFCDSSCKFVDDPDKVCNSTGIGCGGGSSVCDGYSVGECLSDGTQYCDSSCVNKTAVGICITNKAMRKALVHYTTDPYNRKLDISAMKCLINLYLGAPCNDPKSQDYIEIANALSDSILPN
ncbi:MAG: hypothetical protein GQ477_01965 [Nanohaloarchaea archaeon]|nr:hypothetical protein [Candidatus Nanohaloarchaea archaeon]